MQLHLYDLSRGSVQIRHFETQQEEDMIISQTEIYQDMCTWTQSIACSFVIFGAGLASMLGPVLLSKDLEAIELLKDADIGSCFILLLLNFLDLFISIC